MFRIFNWQYFLFLFLAIAIIVSLVIVFRKASEKTKKIINIALMSAMGLFLVLEFIGRILIMPAFKIGDQLPINSFQVFIYISLFAFFSKKSSWKKFAYLIIAPVCAYGLIFIPDVYSYGSSFSLALVSYVLANTSLITNAILNMLWSEEELEKKDILDNTITFVLIIASAHIINVLFRFTGIGAHANYFGTMGDNYDLVIGWIHGLMPVVDANMIVPLLCVLPLLAVLVGVQFLLVLPFDLLSSRKKRQEDIEELIALGNLKKQHELREKSKRPKSQILVRSENKAKPNQEKNITQVKSNSGFLTTNKEIKVNKDHEDKSE